MAENKKKGSQIWSFEVETSDGSISDDKTKTKKRVVASIKKPKELEPLTNKEKSIGLDFQSLPKRKTRSQMAREERARERELNDRATPVRFTVRTTAFFIDLILTGLIVIGVYLYDSSLFKIPLKWLLQLPHEVRQIDQFHLAVAAIALIAYHIVVIIPSILFAGSMGKKMKRIRICNFNERRAGFLQIAFREYVKFFSVASVIGVLILFTNRRKRTLHDLLSLTELLYN